MQKLTQQKVNEFITQGFLVLENFASSEVLLELQESLNSIYEEIDKESNRVEQYMTISIMAIFQKWVENSLKIKVGIILRFRITLKAIL